VSSIHNGSLVDVVSSIHLNDAEECSTGFTIDNTTCHIWFTASLTGATTVKTTWTMAALLFMTEIYAFGQLELWDGAWVDPTTPW
jgi:hypothetical protein